MNKFILTSNQIEILKYLAITTMLIDHINTIVFYDTFILKVIGRLTLPIFSIILIYNYIYNTKNKLSYIYRLTIFGIISEPIFQYVFHDYYDTYTLNIFFTFSLSLLLIYIYETKISNIKYFQKLISVFLIIILIYIISIFISYGIFGILFILSIYIYLKNQKVFNLVVCCILGIIINLKWSIYGSISILLLFPIIKYIQNLKIYNSIRHNKWFFYLFYPLHLLLLKLISYI